MTVDISKWCSLSTRIRATYLFHDTGNKLLVKIMFCCSYATINGSDTITGTLVYVFLISSMFQFNYRPNLWCILIILWFIAILAPRAAAQARPSQSRAVTRHWWLWPGLKPTPSKARPKPRLSGQAGPEHHYGPCCICSYNKARLYLITPSVEFDTMTYLIRQTGQFQIKDNCAQNK